LRASPLSLFEQPAIRVVEQPAKGNCDVREIGLPVCHVFWFPAAFIRGRDFVTTPVRNIENNVTTEKEVFGYFGEPVRRGLENGYETWTYSYQYYELGQLRDFKEL